MLLRVRKAQSTLEYALLVAVVVGALLWMQNYLKRAVQGKLQSSANEISDQYSPGLTQKTSVVDIGHGTTGGSGGTGATIVETTVYGSGGKTTTDVTGGTQFTQTETKIRPLGTEPWPVHGQGN